MTTKFKTFSNEREIQLLALAASFNPASVILKFNQYAEAVDLTVEVFGQREDMTYISMEEFDWVKSPEEKYNLFYLDLKSRIAKKVRTCLQRAIGIEVHT